MNIPLGEKNNPSLVQSCFCWWCYTLAEQKPLPNCLSSGYCHKTPQPGGLNRQASLSHSSAGWTSMARVLVARFLGELSLPGCRRPPPCCVLAWRGEGEGQGKHSGISSTSHKGMTPVTGPTLIDSSHPSTSQGPHPHTPSHLVLGLRHMNLGGRTRDSQQCPRQPDAWPPCRKDSL